MVAITHTPKLKHLDKLLAHCHRRRYTAKSTIIYAGDRCETLFFIIKGSVTILIEDDDGREMIIGYLNSGDFFGELGLFEKEGSEQERSAWVRAKVECEVAEISYAKFRELSQQDSEILYTLGSQMADRLRKTTRKVGDLAFLDVTGRVARTLLDLCQQPDAMTHPDGMQIQDHPPGDRPDRRLLAGNGRTRAEEPGGAGPGACERKDHGGLRHPLNSTHEKGRSQPAFFMGFDSADQSGSAPSTTPPRSWKNRRFNSRPGSSARMNASPTRKA